MSEQLLQNHEFLLSVRQQMTPKLNVLQRAQRSILAAVAGGGTLWAGRPRG